MRPGSCMSGSMAVLKLKKQSLERQQPGLIQVMER